MSTRRQPSMPTTSIEGAAAASRAKARLAALNNPKPVKPPVRHDTVEVNTSVGAGRTSEPQTRALTRVERLHADGMITYEEFQTAGVLRNRFLNELGSSEGVGSYDPSARPSPGWEKADRRAAAILARNRTNRTRLSDLMFAMCGVTDENGDRGFDQHLALLLVRAATEVVDAISLGEIGATRSLYNAEKQRQASGGTTIREALRRGAAHLGFVRLPRFNAEHSWRVADAQIAR